MLQLRPITQKGAFAFIRDNHRHHRPPVGDLWRHSVVDRSGSLVGVATVGRPVARALQDGVTCEVTRVCTCGTKNACSILYGASERAARAQGYQRGLTYLLESEWDRFCPTTGKRTGGASVRAAGWIELWRVAGRRWDCPSRPRLDNHPTENKVAVGWGDWPSALAMREAA